MKRPAYEDTAEDAPSWDEDPQEGNLVFAPKPQGTRELGFQLGQMIRGLGKWCCVLSRLEGCGLNLDSATYQLCDLGTMTLPTWASVSSSVKCVMMHGP